MKELSLKNSDIKAIVDDEDYERLNTRCWTIQKRKNSPDQIVSADRDQIPLKKAVLGRTGGYPSVIHKDGDYLNCQKANLVELTRSALMRTSPKKPGSSGRLGVTHYALRDEWMVIVYHQGRSTTIGYWKNLDHATRAYDHAVRIIKGPDTPTNLSQGWIAPDAVSADVDAKIRAEVERAIQNDQPRYPPPASKKTPKVQE